MDSIVYYKSIMANPKDYDSLKVFSSVADLFISTTKSFKDNDAIVWDNGKKKYSDLYSDVTKLQHHLLHLNFNKGDNVALLFKNEYDFVVSFFACSSLGLVCALLPSSLPEEKCLGLTKMFNLKAMLTNSDCAFIDNNPIFFNVEKALSDEHTYDFIDLKANGNDPACIVFTGGTTGFPKGALLSHRNLCRGAFNGALVNDKVFGLKYLSLIPFTHVFGLVKNLLSCLLSGSTLYTVKNPPSFVKEAGIFKPEVMVLTPGLASIVLTVLKNFGDKIFGEEFKTIICGGAHVPATLVEEFKKFGISCLPGYGLTEAANLVSGNVSIDTKPSSVGIIYPHQEAKIVDGELYIKGDNVFLGYYGNPLASKEVFDGEWLKTGDLAHFDEDGFLYITGRKNNIIVLSSGLKISPEEIEDEISKLPIIKDSLVKKETDSDVLFAEVLLFENNEANRDIATRFILQEVNGKIIEGGKISNVIFRENDFERTPAMKIIRK